MSAHKLSGGTLVFLGALFWSLNSPLVKYLVMDPFLLGGLRALTAGLSLCFFIRPAKLRWNWWMLVYVCSYASLSMCVVLSLKMTSAPIAIGMQYTSTVWLFLAGWICTRKFNVRAAIPILVIIVGVICFMSTGIETGNTAGNCIALCEGIFFSLMTVSARKSCGTNPIGLTAIANLFTGIVVLTLFHDRLDGIFLMSGMDILIILILGAIQVGAGYCFYNMGVLLTSPQKASIIALWEMILGPVWVALFLREYPSPLELTGFLIIILGIVLDSPVSDRFFHMIHIPVQSAHA